MVSAAIRQRELPAKVIPDGRLSRSVVSKVPEGTKDTGTDGKIGHHSHKGTLISMANTIHRRDWSMRRLVRFMVS